MSTYNIGGVTFNQNNTINTFFNINPAIDMFSFKGNRKILANTSLFSMHNNSINTNSNNSINTNSISYNLDFNVAMLPHRKVNIYNLSNLYNYELSMGDGVTYKLGYFNKISHTYKENGNYNITLYGYRNKIYLGKVTKNVNIHYEPLKFIKHFLVYINNMTVTFVDIYNPNSNVLWDFGDGSKGYGAKVIHTYKEYGTYTVKRTFNNEIITSNIIIDSSEKVSFLDDMQIGTHNQGLTERMPKIGLGYDVVKDSGDDFGKLSFYDDINKKVNFIVTSDYDSYFGYLFKQIQYLDDMNTIKLSINLSNEIIDDDEGLFLPSISLRFINTNLPISANLRFSRKLSNFSATDILQVDFSLLYGLDLEDSINSTGIDYLYSIISSNDTGVIKHNTYTISGSFVNLIIKNTGTTLEIYDWDNVHLYTVPIPDDESLSDNLPNYDINNLFTDFVKGLTFNVTYDYVDGTAPE